jgi:CMP-N-acetylneuraminic acid synthetase
MNTDLEEFPTVLGVIPARGGSKRLPRKNIKSLCGHPLIAYTIKAAQGAALLTDYLVSSEDEEILDIARSYGAPTPFVRPAHLATDQVRNIDTVIHALKFMEEKKKYTYDIAVLLQPTCPIRRPEHIDQTIRLLQQSKLSSAVSVKGPFKKRDPILKKICNGILEAYCINESTDDHEAFYLYNASIYAVKRNYLLQEKKLISSRQVPIIMDQFHSIDIDTEADLMVAEAYLNYLSTHEGGYTL